MNTFKYTITKFDADNKFIVAFPGIADVIVKPPKAFITLPFDVFTVAPLPAPAEVKGPLIFKFDSRVTV